ncbi:PREDICTED: chloride channel protein CLC-e [Ipomoea nil]|uniref:chloride channel protein CLC-e n=1 Tax=Ipomoea nil TaxID=35883 RepID=UPI000901149D|nr:PREDICTED: chloride channel protein CLC-e [Ipomoea nil]
MGALRTCGGGSAPPHPISHLKSSTVPRQTFVSFCNGVSHPIPPFSYGTVDAYCRTVSYSRLRLRLRASGPGHFGGSDDQNPTKPQTMLGGEAENYDHPKSSVAMLESMITEGNIAIVSACFVGLFTGICVVLFNIAVHEIRDFCWDGIADQGASWLREEPKEVVWGRVILVPACGGLVVSLLNFLRTTLDVSIKGDSRSQVKSLVQSFLKTLAACVTLGTGNSLGPEGPSVEIGNSIAKGFGPFFDRGAQRKLSLRAAGSAAGISSGFNAAVAGCFFAVESVLWPSPSESSLSLTNTTSMVILSAVVASVVSEIGLGSEPAFAIPDYDFHSPTELPLYLLLGILCGFVSVALSRCTSLMFLAVNNIQQTIDPPKSVFPIVGGVSVGLIALAYPEILYWGFQNVDILLESRPLVKGLSTDLLLQLVVVKIVATSLCRATGLVGGYYAPSLFIGAATGMAYAKILGFISQANPILHISLDVASPQSYGLVGMAATLAGVCQVPLTAVLLLFELTQDYRIVLPLLGAVGMSSWITSGQITRMTKEDVKEMKDEKPYTAQPQETPSVPPIPSFTGPAHVEQSREGDLCELESSLCLNEYDDDIGEWATKILVSQAMRTEYITVLMSTLLMEVVSLMLAEKQSRALIVDDNNFLLGLLTLDDIQQYGKAQRSKTERHEDLIVSQLCSSTENGCRVLWTVTPNTTLLSAQTLMDRHGLNQLPVILEHVEDKGGHPVGILDRECIVLACSALEARECFCSSPTPEMQKH